MPTPGHPDRRRFVAGTAALAGVFALPQGLAQVRSSRRGRSASSCPSRPAG